MTKTYEPPLWLSVLPSSGSVTPGDDVDIDITCDASQLDAGSYNGTLTIQSNDPDEPEINIPVSFMVDALPDVTVVPEFIEFENEQQMLEGIPVMIYNDTDSDVLWS